MCIINNSRNFIFIHVPKAAGTTMSEYYSNYSQCCDVEIGGTFMGESLQKFYGKRFKLGKHATYNELYASMGEALMNKYYIFGVVRSPYDRVKSIYSFLKEWNVWSVGWPKQHKEFSEINSVNEFVLSDFFQERGVDRMFMPQSFWLSNHEGKVAVNYVCKVENLNNDVNNLNKIIGLPQLEGVLGKSNASRLNEIKQFDFERTALDIINKKYEIDFKNFGYQQL